MDKQQCQNRIKEAFENLAKDTKVTFAKRALTVLATICFPIIQFVSLGVATLISFRELILRPQRVYKDLYNRMWHIRSVEKCEKSLVNILADSGKTLPLSIPIKTEEEQQQPQDFIGKKPSKYLH